jgi:hypothetical protein
MLMECEYIVVPMITDLVWSFRAAYFGIYMGTSGLAGFYEVVFVCDGVVSEPISVTVSTSVIQVSIYKAPESASIQLSDKGNIVYSMDSQPIVRVTSLGGTGMRSC